MGFVQSLWSFVDTVTDRAERPGGGVTEPGLKGRHDGCN